MPNPSKKPKLTTVEDPDDLITDTKPVDTEDKPEPIELALIKFRDKTFTIPKDMDEWPTEACLAMGQSEYVLAAKLLLGSGQWALLQSLGDKRKDIREFLVVFGNIIDKDCTG